MKLSDLDSDTALRDLTAPAAPRSASLEQIRETIERHHGWQVQLLVEYGTGPFFDHTINREALADPEQLGGKIAGECIHGPQLSYSSFFPLDERPEGLSEAEIFTADVWENLYRLPDRAAGSEPVFEDDVPPVFGPAELEEIVARLDQHPDALGPIFGPALRLAHDPERKPLPDEIDLIEIDLRQRISAIDPAYDCSRDLVYYAEQDPRQLREWIGAVVAAIADHLRRPRSSSRFFYQDGYETYC